MSHSSEIRAAKRLAKQLSPRALNISPSGGAYRFAVDDGDKAIFYTNREEDAQTLVEMHNALIRLSLRKKR